MSETTTLLRDEQRTVPMSAIVVREEFNPRKRFDEAELNRMAATMTRVGLLQPLLVRPAAGAAGGYELVDGERRYRAAFQAGLTEVPVLVRARDENTDGLVEALAANFHRAAHTPVEEAQAFGRLLAAGLTRRGISEQLAVSRELVRERLEILELPEDLHSAIDDGTIPLGAVKALVTLAKIHPGLPACAVRRVSTAPTEPWRRAASWSDVIEDPVGVVTTQYADERPDLPEGVFDADCGYPLAGFALGEQGEKDLRALVQLNPAWGDREQVRVTFSAELVAQAAALGATHRSPRGYSTLIVGQEVADQLARDAIKAQLKSERARARREREADKLATTTGAETNVAADPEPETAEQAKERRRLERETELERRRQAHAFNGELGIAVLKAFAKVKVDHRVLQVLSAVDFKDDLDGLADRGARYGFPGWPQEEQTRSGKTKVVYLERYQAARKAREFLSGATTGADVAGRCLALVVMAALADEACVAQSNRSQFSLHAYKPSPYAYTAESDGGLPWREQVVELVEDLALERLPEHLTVAVREHRQHATQQQAEADRAEPQQAEPDSLEPQSAATSESLDATGREEAEAEASTPSDDSAIAE